MKHTIPDCYAGALTIFDGPDHSGYLDYTGEFNVVGDFSGFVLGVILLSGALGGSLEGVFQGGLPDDWVGRR